MKECHVVEEMTQKERVLATIDRSETDRIPVVPWQCGWSSKLLGKTWREHANDPEIHAAAQLAVLEQTGVDGLTVNIGTPVEAASVGCLAEEEDHGPVRVAAGVIDTIEDIEKLALPDPETDRYMSTMLGAMRILKAEVGDEVALWGGVNAPFQVGGLLRGLQDWMMDTIINPELVRATLDFATELVVLWARSLARAGADVLFMGDSLASGDMISVPDYVTWAIDSERAVMEAAKDEGARAQLHICGRTSDRWDEMTRTNADLLDLDTPVDLAAAKAAVGDRVAVRGNVSTTLLSMGTREEVYENTRDLIERVGPGSFIVGTGCEIGDLTPVANIAAMAEATKDHGNWR
jgi:MtaA/CmuA family methyltransferase